MYKLRTYICGWLLCLFTFAQAQTLSENARISLITCTPGEELYARYGHTAIRVYDEANEMDITLNYGIFDFNTDHFYWKFVKGETWYELGAAPTWWFMQEYEAGDRPVYEQVLNLTAEQREALWQALETNYQPQNTLFCIILSKNGAEKQEMRQISHNYDRFTYHTPSRGELQ